MGGLTKFVAAVARHPMNFIKAVAEDIETLNQQAADKPISSLSGVDEEALQAELKRRARAAREAGSK